ncbi:MAG: sialate O-acetylesterase [Planctomycetota bacterium]
MLITISISFDVPAKPLRIYILAGQSNMEGHANIRTFEYIGEDPETKPLLDLMTDDDGKPVTADRVWVSNATEYFEDQGVLSGMLTAGFGARQNPSELGDNIGPEYTFGLKMQQAYNGPILIIKTAWGGKSLHTDLRPPSAGPYTLSVLQKRMYPTGEGHGVPEDLEQWMDDKIKATGVYYRKMIEHINKVLADPGKIVPGYRKDAGYEIAGFVWFQGWNDLAAPHVYPHELGAERYNMYSQVLTHFIEDVRKELKEPEMPFIIGVMGVGGPIGPTIDNDQENTQVLFREAMAKPAKHINRVTAVPTAPYGDQALGQIEMHREKIRQAAYLLRVKDKNHANADGSMDEAEQRAYLAKMQAELIKPEDDARWERGASNAGYHYLGCAKTIAQIGVAFAESLLNIED